MFKGCFVTGTDTGIGKTLGSCVLLTALARHHAKVVGMKPIASGLIPHEGGWASEDALALRAASTLKVPPELDNPISLPDPLSPHLAAARAGRRIELPFLVERYQTLAAQADVVVVEGAGGWYVPLNEQHMMSDLAAALGLPVVLVVGLRLGCLNHAALSAEAIQARGLTLAGWVANRVDPDMACQEENLDWLKTHMARRGVPLLADIPWQAQPDPHRATVTLPTDWT
jgi:dethiobiotin synthetase